MDPYYSQSGPSYRKSGKRTGRSRRNPFMSASTNILSNSESTNNFMFNSIMAQSLSSSDYRQEKKKEAIMQALENQDRMLSGFGPPPQGNPLDTKIVRMAKMLEREKKERRKRERRERNRWKMMMDEMLKWSIMLNSGGNFDPSLFSMGFKDFGSNAGIDLSQFQMQSGGGGFSPLGMGGLGAMGGGDPNNPNQQGGGNAQEELRRKQEEKLKKKRAKAKARKAEKRRRKQIKEAKLKEIRAREAADLKSAQAIMANKASKNANQAQQELEDERERSRLAEEERIRREKAEKEARELAIRMKAKRNEMLWTHFQGICYHYMAPLIFFETVRAKVSKQKIPSWATQNKVFKGITGVMTECKLPCLSFNTSINFSRLQGET